MSLTLQRQSRISIKCEQPLCLTTIPGNTPYISTKVSALVCLTDRCVRTSMHLLEPFHSWKRCDLSLQSPHFVIRSSAARIAGLECAHLPSTIVDIFATLSLGLAVILAWLFRLLVWSAPPAPSPQDWQELRTA
jgi:hypothetical protein